MIRGLLKLILLVVIVVAVGAYALGYWTFDQVRHAGTAEPAQVGTSGHVDTEKAREAGAKIGEKTAVVADRAKLELEDGALTAKIKSKMALDDTIHASRIHVSTDNSVVTLTGSVQSTAERQRAVQLARETNGVKAVRDRLEVR